MAYIYNIKFTISSSLTANTSYDRFWILVTTGNTTGIAKGNMTGGTSCEFITTGRSGGDCAVCYLKSTLSSLYIAAACVSPGSTSSLGNPATLLLNSTATTYTMTIPWYYESGDGKRLITAGIVSFFKSYKSNPKAIYSSGTTYSLGYSKGYTSDGNGMFSIYYNGSLVPSPGKRRYPVQCFSMERMHSENLFHERPGYTLYVDTTSLTFNSNVPWTFYHMYTNVYASSTELMPNEHNLIQSNQSSYPVPGGSSVTVNFTKPMGNSVDNVNFVSIKIEGYFDSDQTVNYWGLNIHDSNMVISKDIQFNPDNMSVSTGYLTFPIADNKRLGNITVEIYD